MSNINYEDKGLIVRYIQSFLKENYSNTVKLTGVYDSDTHDALVAYIKLPVTESAHDFQLALEAEYDRLNDFFVSRRGVDEITYEAKETTDEILSYMSSIRYQINHFAKSKGWRLAEFTNFNNANNDKYTIRVEKYGGENYFPRTEAITMLNLFDNVFYRNLSIRDGIGQDDIIHTSEDFKIAVVPINAGDVYTLAHGYPDQQQIVVGVSDYPLAEIVRGDVSVYNVMEAIVPTGGHIVYTVPDDDTLRYMIIQMPNIEFDAGTIKVPIQIGDINFDGNVDNDDLEMLQKHLDNETILTGKAFVAGDINGDGVIDNTDKAVMQDYLEEKIPMFGITWYDEPISTEDLPIESGRLLIVSGDHATEYNLPLSTFNETPWLVHDTFLNYLFDRAITPFSDDDSIAYLQGMISDYYTGEYITYRAGFYDDKLRSLVRRFQGSYYFAFGFLDVKTEARLIRAIYHDTDAIYRAFYRGW